MKDNTQYRYIDTNPSYHPGLTPTVPGHFESDKHVFFWSGPFSNWDMGNFTATLFNDNITFNCSEQAMMYCKAFIFKDYGVAEKILATKSPREQKALGRTVKNFDQAAWEGMALERFTPILVAKFTTVPGYEKILLDTGTKTIVEASPFDAVWGIKMGVNNPDILDESKWQGKNLLGLCLMAARDIIRKSE